MTKLTICAIRWGQSTPNVRAICSIWLPPSASANRTRTFMIHIRKVSAPGRQAPASRCVLFRKEQRVEHDRLREGNRQNGLDHYLGGRIGIAADRLTRFHTYQPYCDSGSERRQTYVQTSAHRIASFPATALDSTQPPTIMCQFSVQSPAPLPRADKSGA